MAATDADYRYFLQKLLSPVAAKAEYMDFLLIADILHSAGLKVLFSKPIPTQKTPDLVITDPINSEKIFGEVSSSHAKKVRTDQDNSYHDLRKIIAQYLRNPLYSANQLQLPPPLYQKNLVQVLARLQIETEEKNT